MIQQNAAEEESVDCAGPFANWGKYTAMRRLADYDDIFGDELSVPVIYVPL